jgi:hypothetical protein
MYKILKLFISILILIGVSGCDTGINVDSVDSNDTTATELPIEEDFDKQTEVEIQNTYKGEVQILSSNMSDEEIMNYFNRAYQIFSWFSDRSMPCKDTTIIKNDKQYNKIQYSEYENNPTKYDDLKKALKLYFSEDVSTELLNLKVSNNNKYIDVDGDIYGIMTDMGGNIYKGDLTYKIKRDKSYITITATVELLNVDDGKTVIGYEDHDYILHLNEDGIWRLENIDYIYSGY